MTTSKRNPFTPGFGVAPLVLAGRDRLVDDLVGALDSWPGDPALSTIVVGAHGTGKTSLLTVIADEAPAHGWLAANVTAADGMLEDVIERATEAADEFVELDANARLKSVNIAQIFGAEWEYRDPASGNWRTRMNNLLDTLAQHDIGLLITVDETRADSADMLQLATVYQHFLRERRKVALLMAGLPDNVGQLVDDKTVSFLRRASRRYIGRIGNAEVKAAAKRTVEASGRTIGAEALDLLADACEGFPYMMQLVGYRSWAQRPDQDDVSTEDVVIGAELAHEDMERQILAPTWASLAKGDRGFVTELARLGGIASLADVSAAMGKATNYTTKNRSRLTDRGVIQTLESGDLAFAIPGLAQYVLNV